MPNLSPETNNYCDEKLRSHGIFESPTTMSPKTKFWKPNRIFARSPKTFKVDFGEFKVQFGGMVCFGDIAFTFEDS